MVNDGFTNVGKGGWMILINKRIEEIKSCKKPFESYQEIAEVG